MRVSVLSKNTTIRRFQPGPSSNHDRPCDPDFDALINKLLRLDRVLIVVSGYIDNLHVFHIWSRIFNANGIIKENLKFADIFYTS